jgi:hypothetical protein
MSGASYVLGTAVRYCHWDTRSLRMFKSSRESLSSLIDEKKRRGKLVHEPSSGRRVGDDWLSSYEGRAVDALGQRADEGRGKRRYAGGSCNQALIPGFPNGVTHWSDPPVLPDEHIVWVEGSR